MGQDHLQVREGHRHAVDVARVGVVEVGELNRRRALVEEDRQAQLLGAPVDGEGLLAERVEVLVVRARA